MCDSQHSKRGSILSRRGFVTSSTALASAGLLATGLSGRSSADAVDDVETVLPLTKATRDALTPAQIIERAKAGNLRFRTGRKIRREFLAEMKATAEGQFPAAVLLSCIDSRAPAEILFNLGLGDVFNCRIAGNIENPDILGSMEFATKLSGAKVVFVLGHSACGAVQGAIAGAQLGNLTQLLTRIEPSIKATEYAGERTAANPEFVDAVARTNVRMTMDNIRRRSQVIAELEKSRAIQIAGGFYDMATGAVEFFE
jgi:carbonic anhydrase